MVIIWSALAVRHDPQPFPVGQHLKAQIPLPLAKALESC